MGWNAGAGTRLDRLRTIVAAPTHHRGEMNRMIVNEAGDDVGQANHDGMLIKGHQRIDVELTQLAQNRPCASGKSIG